MDNEVIFVSCLFEETGHCIHTSAHLRAHVPKTSEICYFTSLHSSAVLRHTWANSKSMNFNSLSGVCSFLFWCFVWQSFLNVLAHYDTPWSRTAKKYILMPTLITLLHPSSWFKTVRLAVDYALHFRIFKCLSASQHDCHSFQATNQTALTRTKYETISLNRCSKF